MVVAEPPELYSPHVPVIVSLTFDCSTYKPHNPGSLLGVLEKPKSSTHSFRVGYITEDIAVLQQFKQIDYIRVNSRSLTNHKFANHSLSYFKA
jgi:hypothetical protein